ncbi:uncharacterized protein LOC130736017 [Lotus japonicus]|uniref:uncharacterized protein LOC130736017 n=1 Tax=Lotus japonicus TaxID=34305 RepID=UPI0025901D72|nr:uncharacterized protein LOC130736017 [Lotus japonicus]
MREKYRERVGARVAGRERGRYGANGGYGRVQEKGNITSYVFTNFPEEWDEKSMWGVFQRYGRVWAVFISPRRDRRGKRFGVVRFMNVQDPKQFEWKLDGIIIGSTKLHVNIPRFIKGVKATPIPLGSNQKQDAWRKDDRVGGHKKPLTVPTRSYAQVVTDKSVKSTSDSKCSSMGDDLRGVPVETWTGPPVPAVDDWLRRSLVGVLKNPEWITSVQDAFILEGFHTIQVKYLGDDLVLLSGPEGVDLEQALAGAKEWIEEVFQVVYTWSPAVVLDHRLAWVRCSGLPINMWTRNCLAHLVLPAGNLVAVDEATTSLSRLEFARVQVQTSSLGLISNFRKINVNGTVYTVRIIEELGGAAPVAGESLVPSTGGESSALGWSEKDADDEVGTVLSDVGGEGSPVLVGGGLRAAINGNKIKF